MVRAAMELADEHGIAALSMRQLGRRLVVEAASLYNHVSGKDDLLGAMVEQVVNQIDVPAGGVAWSEAMRRRAVSARAVFGRHPWAAALIDSRQASGPASLAYADRVLAVLLGAGFSPRTAGNAFLALDSYIYGYERQHATLSMGDGEDNVEQAREVLEAAGDAIPSLILVAREYASVPYDDESGFAFGLDLLLDGLERILEQQRIG